jgi:hypothetical protein
MTTEAETSTDMVLVIATPVRRRAAIPEEQAGSAHSVAEPLTRIEAPRIAGAFRRCGWEAGIDRSKSGLTGFGNEHASIMGEAAAAEASGFTFLQISDSHIGFHLPSNPNALGTLYGP